MQELRTPGVYINELNAFPNSVVEVASAVPAFVGYTERAARGTEKLTGIPTRITWKAGTLAGATPDDAFSVNVGLGSTMTANDILAGLMRVTVGLAAVRPAEFIVVTFEQEMQTS